MGVETVTTEYVSGVEAKRLWKAMVVDSHNLMTTVLPDVFSSITLCNGNGGPGTVKHIAFGPNGNKDFEYVKEKVEEVDEEKMVYKYSLLEGGLLGKTVKSATFAMKFEPAKEGGCVVKNESKFDVMDGVQKDPSKLKEFQDAIYALAQVLDAYLLSHPQLYA